MSIYILQNTEGLYIVQAYTPLEAVATLHRETGQVAEPVVTSDFLKGEPKVLYSFSIRMAT